MASRNRGKSKPKLRDLGRKLPTTEEAMEVFRAARIDSDPITAAILGAVLVESELEALLRHRLKRQSDTEWAELVADNGPLSTFHRKILLGRALRLYGEEVNHNLNIIRNIRNTFAHAKKLITFEHELVVAELRSTAIPKVRKRGHRDVKSLKWGGQGCYLSLSHHVSMMLLQRHNAAYRASNRRYKLKTEKRMAERLSPLARLMADPQLVQTSSKLNPLSFPQSQSAEAPQGWLGEVLHRAAKSDDKAGK
jgi:hypothetical protein